MMDKKSLAQALKEVGIALELMDPNPFRARAYLNAARTVERSPYSLDELVLMEKARTLKGIGAAMDERIKEYYAHGQLLSQADLLDSVPMGLWDLLTIPNLGTKRVRTLFELLEITSLSELEYACHENRLLDLPGFGPKLQANVLAGLEQVRSRAGQVLLPEARRLAAHWLEEASSWPSVYACEITGDCRRSTVTTATVSLLLGTSEDPANLVQMLAPRLALPESEIFARAPIDYELPLSLLRARLPEGPSLEIYVTPMPSFAFSHLVTTGSEAHLSSLNGHGFASKFSELRQLPTETAIYEALGLPFIPPVLREDGEEVAWAAAGSLPALLQVSDLPGVLHVHTNYSDGVSSVREMAEAAAARGYSYLGIADHSQTASYAGGLTEDRVRAQWQEIDELNAEGLPIRLLKGIESDILPAGGLDYDDALLKGFDYVIASVHSSLRQPEEEMMPRLLGALAHPAVTMLGHPTNRLLLGRDESAIDMPLLLAQAARYGKAMELNANPHRLDLDWHRCRQAKKLGVKIAINPDAHRPSGFDDMEYGVLVAQKAGLTVQDLYLYQ